QRTSPPRVRPPRTLCCGATFLSPPVQSSSSGCTWRESRGSMSQPFAALLQSRKFLLAVLDAVVTLTLYFVGQYAPAVLPDAKFLIVTLQPVILIVIGAYAYEDAQIKSALAAVDRQFQLNSNAHETSQTRDTLARRTTG